MLTVAIICWCLGGVLILTAALLALRIRRRGGTDVYSRGWFGVVVLGSMGAAIAVGPPLSMYLSS